MCFVGVGVKTYRTVDLQEQGWAALLSLLNDVCFVRVGSGNLEDGRSPGKGLGRRVSSC